MYQASDYFLSDGFFEANISTVAAPVFNADNQVVAAIGVTIPGAQIPAEQSDTLITRVKAAALTLSRCLDYTGP